MTQRNTFQLLKGRPDLKVVITDKNLGPALFTMEHYIQLCVDHLSDSATYERQRAPVEALTQLVRTRVRNWYQNVAKTYAYYTD